jgi:alkanesulfonate monooxygenase SsuD/methylene tetrahydromethanopterin reductase-like flavin-dependent oxidoreductase (luciferase family)
VDLAVAAEEAGFDSVWAGDSLLARPRAEPLTLLAAVATRTTRVELGTAVLLASMRNPEQLAQSAATLDAVSGGRLILGIGAGPDTPGVRSDFALVGADFPRRSSRAFATADRVRSLWRGDGEDGDGGDQMFPLPGRFGGPPIWYGGAGPKALQRTGQRLDGWFPIAPTVDAFTAGLERVRAAEAAAGRPAGEVTANLYATVVLGEPATAQAQLAEHSQLYYGVPHEVIARQQGSVAGTEEQVVTWLRGFIDAGADHLCIRFGCADTRGQLERFAPLLAQLR